MPGICIQVCLMWNIQHTIQRLRVLKISNLLNSSSAFDSFAFTILYTSIRYGRLVCLWFHSRNHCCKVNVCFLSVQSWNVWKWPLLNWYSKGDWRGGHFFLYSPFKNFSLSETQITLKWPRFLRNSFFYELKWWSGVQRGHLNKLKKIISKLINNWN